MSGAPITRVEYPGLDQRVRVFRHGSLVDTFALTGTRLTLVIDTGERPEAMETVLEHLPDDRPLFVLNTHGDWDHVWGNAFFTGAHGVPIVGHPLTAKRMLDAAPYLEQRQREEPGTYDAVRIVTPHHLLTEGRFDLGGLTAILVPTPGHTPDHLAAWVPELRLLIAGDAAEFPFPAISEDGSLVSLRASLQRMIDLNPVHLLCCHAPGRTSPVLLQHNAEYFAALVRHAEAGTLDAWDFEAALPPDTAEDDIQDPEFYRRFHRENRTAARLGRG